LFVLGVTEGLLTIAKLPQPNTAGEEKRLRIRERRFSKSKFRFWDSRDDHDDESAIIRG
jgi:hypothetical protein